MCFKTGLIHIEQNQLKDAMSCLDEAFLAMAKDLSLGTDIKPQARICAQYKIAVLLLQVIQTIFFSGLLCFYLDSVCYSSIVTSISRINLLWQNSFLVYLGKIYFLKSECQVVEMFNCRNV